MPNLGGTPVERKVVEQLPVLCPGCLVPLQVEEPGSETPRWARCPRCDDYLYWVGNVICTGTTALVFKLSPEEQQMVRSHLGEATLLPWAVEHIGNLRRRLGLPDEWDDGE